MIADANTASIPRCWPVCWRDGRPAYSCNAEPASPPGSTCASAHASTAGILPPKKSIGGIPSAPAVTGTKARIGGTKRAKNTASVPQRWKNASLCAMTPGYLDIGQAPRRSEEHTSELQSHHDLVCRLLLEKKKKKS